MNADRKNEIENLVTELRKYPTYADTGAGVRKDDLALANTVKIIEISQKIISLIANDRRFYEERELAYWRLLHSLEYRSRVYFEKSVYWSDTTLLRNVSKQELLEYFKSKGNDISSVHEAIKNLNQLLSDDLQEYLPSGYVYLFLRCNCYRILGDYEKAIKDAEKIIRKTGRDGHLLLEACYLDNMNYADATRLAEKRYQEIIIDLER